MLKSNIASDKLYLHQCPSLRKVTCWNEHMLHNRFLWKIGCGDLPEQNLYNYLNVFICVLVGWNKVNIIPVRFGLRVQPVVVILGCVWVSVCPWAWRRDPPACMYAGWPVTAVPLTQISLLIYIHVCIAHDNDNVVLLAILHGKKTPRPQPPEVSFVWLQWHHWTLKGFGFWLQ